MSCHECLNRRAFLAKSALAAAAAAIVTGCGNGEFGPPLPSSRGRPTGALTIKVSDFPGLQAVGTLVEVAPQRAAMRTAAATFIAMSMICTHQGCDTAVVSGTMVVCPCHGSRFDKNGDVIEGPADQPLARFQTAYDAQTDELTIS